MLRTCSGLLMLGLLTSFATGAQAGWQPDLERLDALPLHVAPADAVAKGIAASENQKGRGPALFAVAVPLAVDLDGGRWDQPEAGTARWRTRVYSAGAQSLVLVFEGFELPAGAKLRIHDVGGSTVRGPYTRAHQNADGRLHTPIVHGDTAIIELRLPATARDSARLQLRAIGHGYKNVSSLGDSGACNIDVVCPLGNDWRDEIRSVVKLQIPVGSNFGLCSGTLVNNLRQDGKPYVLTADHCGIGNAGSPASGVVTYWNFENSACSTNNAGDGQNQTGAVLRARDAVTDMSLIELNQAPNAAFNVHFAGFDASGTGGSDGVGIHHPAGDAKKISAYTQALVADTVQIEQGGPTIPAWRVSRWQQGTTEQGSSGSGLWNQNRHIVGTLSGGSAACIGNVDNDQPDFYARLDQQWTANTAASGQLKAWLDPDNTGQRVVAGRDPGAAMLTLVNDSATLAEDAPATDLPVLANDPTGLTLLSVTAPNRGGSAVVVGNLVRYAPAANVNGTETFSYSAGNGSQTGTATVTITINAVNDPPTALNDSVQVTRDTTTDLAVLSNDSSAPDGVEVLTLTSVSGFSAGGAAIIVGNQLRYTPAAGFTGTETFQYTIRDPGNATDTATVTVTVVPPPLVLVNDSATIDEDAAAVDLAVLANDPAGLSLLSVTAPNRGGSAVIVGNMVRYTPAAHVNGTETFSYTASNGSQTGTATVTITINAVNDPPTAVNDNFAATSGVATNLPVLGNDSAAPDSGETLTLLSTDGFSSGGSASISGSQLVYTSATGFSGQETFSYTIRDPGGLTSTATVTMTVTPAGSSTGGGDSGGGGGGLGSGLLAGLGLAVWLRRRA